MWTRGRLARIGPWRRQVAPPQALHERRAFSTGTPHNQHSKLSFDFRQFREQAPAMKDNLYQRNADADVNIIVDLSTTRSRLTVESEKLRKQRNEMTDRLTREAKTLPADLKKTLQADARDIREKIASMETELQQVEATLFDAAKKLPNWAHADSPRRGNPPRVVKLVGEKPTFQGFEPKSHLELGADLDILHFPTAVGASKTYYAKNDGALLELALVNWALREITKHGFTPMTTPDIIHPKYAEACGFQPRSEATQIYSIANDDLVLVGTQEIPLAALYYDTVIHGDKLPIKIAAFGHCFRAETGGHGAENKGLYRVHQFSKVEMFVFCKPEDSEKTHLQLLDIEIALLSSLGLHFQVLDMPTDDLGASAFRKFDIEAWMPSRNGYGEVTSASNCTDYQTRRLFTRFRENNEIKFAHSLNATALAVPRITLAILENFQQKDGSVKIPDVLVPFMGKPVIEPLKKV